jgi:hypothetical protein
MAASLKWYYTGGIASSEQRHDSLGGSSLTTIELIGGLQNLFDNVTAAEAEAGDTEYRCLDLFASEGDFYDILLYVDSTQSSASTFLQMAFETRIETNPNWLPAPLITKRSSESQAPDTIYDAVWMFHSGDGAFPIPQVGNTVWATRDHAVTGVVRAVTNTRIVISGTWGNPLKFRDGDIIEKTDGTRNVESIMDAMCYSRAFPAGTTEWSDVAPLELPIMHANERCRIWFKRIVNSSAPSTSNDSYTVTVEYIQGTLLTSTSSSTTA